MSLFALETARLRERLKEKPFQRRVRLEKSTLGLALPKVMINWTIQAQFSSLTRPGQFNETILSLNHAQHVAPYINAMQTKSKKSASNSECASLILSCAAERSLGCQTSLLHNNVIAAASRIIYIYSTRAATPILSRVRSFTHTKGLGAKNSETRVSSHMENNTRTRWFHII